MSHNVVVGSLQRGKNLCGIMLFIVGSLQRGKDLCGIMLLSVRYRGGRVYVA